jgi:hypothetical protein
MNNVGMKIAALGLMCCLAAWMVEAQDAENPAYLDPSIPAEQRSADLMHRMTPTGKGASI